MGFMEILHTISSKMVVQSIPKALRQSNYDLPLILFPVDCILSGFFVNYGLLVNIYLPEYLPDISLSILKHQ